MFMVPVLRRKARISGGGGVAPFAPVLSITSAGNDNTPNFAVDLPFGNGAPNDAVAGDVLRIFNVTAAADYVVHTLTSGEIGGSPIALTSITPVAQGNNTFEARLERGAAASAWSPTVSITIDSIAPTITSASSTNVDENLTLSFGLTANEAVTWSITGGADAARFEISGSTLRWLGNGSKDFEAPNDADLNNIYIVQVTATDTATNATNQTISVTVNNVADTTPAFVLTDRQSFSSVFVNGVATLNIGTQGQRANGGVVIVLSQAGISSGSGVWAANGPVSVGSPSFSTFLSNVMSRLAGHSEAVGAAVCWMPNTGAGATLDIAYWAGTGSDAVFVNNIDISVYAVANVNLTTPSATARMASAANPTPQVTPLGTSIAIPATGFVIGGIGMDNNTFPTATISAGLTGTSQGHLVSVDGGTAGTTQNVRNESGGDGRTLAIAAAAFGP